MIQPSSIYCGMRGQGNKAEGNKKLSSLLFSFSFSLSLSAPVRPYPPPLLLHVGIDFIVAFLLLLQASGQRKAKMIYPFHSSSSSSSSSDGGESIFEAPKGGLWKSHSKGEKEREREGCSSSSFFNRVAPN